MASCVHPNALLEDSIGMIDLMLKTLPHEFFSKNQTVYKRLHYYLGQAKFYKSLRTSNVGVAFKRQGYANVENMIDKLSDNAVLAQYKFKKNQDILKALEEIAESHEEFDAIDHVAMANFILHRPNITIPEDDRTPQQKSQKGGFFMMNIKYIVDQILAQDKENSSMLRLVIQTILQGISKDVHWRLENGTLTMTYDNVYNSPLAHNNEFSPFVSKIVRNYDKTLFLTMITFLGIFFITASDIGSEYMKSLAKNVISKAFQGKPYPIKQQKKFLGLIKYTSTVNNELELKREMNKLSKNECIKKKTSVPHDFSSTQ